MTLSRTPWIQLQVDPSVIFPPVHLSVSFAEAIASKKVKNAEILCRPGSIKYCWEENLHLKFFFFFKPGNTQISQASEVNNLYRTT